MKWFKHNSDAHTNLKTGNVIAEHGAKAYGLWWICVELIASQGEMYRLGADKNWKKGLIRASGMTKEEIDPLLQFFAEERLIDADALKEAQLYIPKLAEYCDDYSSRSVRTKSESVRTISEKVPLEENRKEENRKEVKESAAPLTPVFERKIREKEDDYSALVKDLAAKDYLTAAKIHSIMLTGFLPYWLEKGENARKARWEKEKAFDYLRRSRTWISRYHEMAKDFMCREGFWHGKGETCHHQTPEPDYKSFPASDFAKSIAESKRVNPAQSTADRQAS